MELSDLLDAEVQLGRDEEARRAGGSARTALERRDAAFGRVVQEAVGREGTELRRGLDADRGLREEVVALWLEEVETTGAPRPGRRVRSGLRASSWILLLVGGLLGFGATRGVLAYDGTAPVNVFGFLGLLVGFQLLLLLLLVVAVAARRRSGGPPGSGPVAMILRALVRSPWLARFVGADRGTIEAGLGVFQAKRALYAPIERWVLFGLGQRFGVAFNVAALVTFLYLVIFTDLAFGWSTTLAVDPDAFHALLMALAAPWAPFLDAAVPSLELVRDTQWVRLEGGAFVGGKSLADAALVAREWWPFLGVALFFWGLLPRCAALLLARRRERSALAAVALDHAAFQRLFDRLTSTGAAWDAPAPDLVGRARPRAARGPVRAAREVSGLPERAEAGPRRPASPSQEAASARRPTPSAGASPAREPEAPAEGARSPETPPVSAPERAPAETPSPKAPRPTARRTAVPTTPALPTTCVAAWGHLPTEGLPELVADRLGIPVARVLPAGGDLRAEAEGLESLRAVRPERVLLLVSAGVQPTRDLFGWLEAAREGLAEGGRLEIVLLDRTSEGTLEPVPREELEQWQARIDAEGDLYLRLTALEPA